MCGVVCMLLQLMVNFCLDDNNHKPVSIDEKMKASDVAHLLVLKGHAKEDKNWVVVEHISKFDMGSYSDMAL